MRLYAGAAVVGLGLAMSPVPKPGALAHLGPAPGDVIQRGLGPPPNQGLPVSPRWGSQPSGPEPSRRPNSPADDSRPRGTSGQDSSDGVQRPA